MDEPSVTLEMDGPVARLMINRPKALNALNPDVLQSIILSFDKISRQNEVRAIVIGGEGEKAFVAGADVAAMSSLGPRAMADYLELGQRAMRVIETAAAPVIAAVHGYALGGGLELALACDMIVAGPAARFGQPEINLGIIPGFGGTQRLVQRCGIGTARRLVLTGELVAADEALRLGLVDYLEAAATPVARAIEIAKSIAQKAPLAVRAAKQVIRQSQETILLSGLRHEAEVFLKLFATHDRSEGMAAFLEKRAPVFSAK